MLTYIYYIVEGYMKNEMVHLYNHIMLPAIFDSMTAQAFFTLLGVVASVLLLKSHRDWASYYVLRRNPFYISMSIFINSVT